MATSVYDEVLKLVDRLPREEQQQLVSELATRLAQPSPTAATGAALVAFLQSMGPVDPAVLDEMEWVIQQDCERIDPRDW